MKREVYPKNYFLCKLHKKEMLRAWTTLEKDYIVMLGSVLKPV
jgi:hypothetical protein